MPQKKTKDIKICISSTGPYLDATLDPRFGRATFFLIVDNKGKLIKTIKNSGVQAMHGAGITAAQIVANEKISAVITGNIGPNAFMVLNASGIKIFTCSSGITVQDAFAKYQEGKLQETLETSSRHAGFGRGFGQIRQRRGNFRR